MTDAPKPGWSPWSWFVATWSKSSIVGKIAMVLGAIVFVFTGLFLFWVAWATWQRRDDNLGRGLAIAAGILGMFWFGGVVSGGFGDDGTTSVTSTTTTEVSATSTTERLSTTTTEAPVASSTTSVETTTTSGESSTTTKPITTTTAKPTTTTTSKPTTTTTSKPTTTTTKPPQNCDPSYPDFCIPPPPPDLNCGDIPQKNFTVLQPDPHGFDGNKDGVGCES